MRWLNILLVLLIQLPCFAQQTKTDSSKKDNLKIFPLPVVYYTPETRFGFGAVSLATFRLNNESSAFRNSQIQFGGAFTQNKQLLFYLPYNIFYQEENYYFFGEMGYYQYSYNFYGIGSNLAESQEELYKVNFPRVRINATKKVKPSIYLGLRYWFDDYKITNVKTNGLLDKSNIDGSKGGIVSSLGFIGLLDNRDNYNYPTKGNYLELLLLPNLKTFGSNFNFIRYAADYVNYTSLNNKLVMVNNVNMVAISGNPPFNEMAFIGGRSKMRGYYLGRFRDRNLILHQIELRKQLFWKIGMVGFLGNGIVAAKPDSFSIDNLKTTAGVGLRYTLDEKEKINIRLDYGFAKQSSGIYLTIGEAF